MQPDSEAHGFHVRFERSLPDGPPHLGEGGAAPPQVHSLPILMDVASGSNGSYVPGLGPASRFEICLQEDVAAHRVSDLKELGPHSSKCNFYGREEAASIGNLPNRIDGKTTTKKEAACQTCPSTTSTSYLRMI